MSRKGASVLPINEAVRPTGERSTLAQDVYARLKQSIFDFDMPPGQRYSEYELAETLQVSRTPLRLALHVLAHEGFLQNIGGHSSWQVKPLDLAFYEDIYDFRVEIEAVALRRICAPDAAPLPGALQAFWCRPPERRERVGTLVADRDEAFHRTLVSLAGSQAMLRSFDDLTERIRIIRRLDFVSLARIMTTYDEHAAILRAVESRDAALAERLIRQHIEASRIEIRRITFHNLALARAAAQGSESTVSSGVSR